ncbi:hypothetical protein D3C72_1832990 [compost metagenome]
MVGHQALGLKLAQGLAHRYAAGLETGRQRVLLERRAGGQRPRQDFVAQLVPDPVRQGLGFAGRGLRFGNAHDYRVSLAKDGGLRQTSMGRLRWGSHRSPTGTPGEPQAARGRRAPLSSGDGVRRLPLCCFFCNFASSRRFAAQAISL